MKTPLLQLKNIGKIYVSESNVSVGIRGVDLSFERGEFVAITGRSGSGKSTLLNVISGMDTYEEGEMLVEGEPTSHYMQKDWEQYRKDYISFIFQDYNIIESFTVLQNVELALMNIENPKERRARALELLRRVGLEKHIHHKGSKLSGGQKQRTVIARALAKDSPIILADEPTGNLDSQSSAEIIELLREVSRDKLLIVVTHNFEQVEACATRHIRVFDGAIELDQRVRPPVSPVEIKEEKPTRENSISLSTPPKKHTLRNGIMLGRVRFGATPKLSIFLCILMTLTALVITMITSQSDDATGLFEKSRMFTHIDGRIVIVRSDGAVIKEDELKNLATDIGAKDFMHYDFMLDRSVFESLDEDQGDLLFTFGYPASTVTPDVGRLPEKDHEILLEVPISNQLFLGDKSTFAERSIFLFNMTDYTVVGVNYYYDNTREPRMLFTENGYKIASALCFYNAQGQSFRYQLHLKDDGRQDVLSINTFVDFDMAPGTYYINSNSVNDAAMKLGVSRDKLALDLFLTGTFTNYDEYGEYGVYIEEDVYQDSVIGGKPGYGEQATVSYMFDSKKAVWTLPNTTRERLENRFYTTWSDQYGVQTEEFVLVAPDVLADFLYQHYYTQAYTQASLFFENDREAHEQVEVLRRLGYVGVVSDETVEEDVLSQLLRNIVAGISAAGWLMSIVFASLFLSLCSSRAMNATRGDIAIMRSMGIPTGVVRISIYVQTFIALIPAVLVTAVTCTVIYLLPKTNYMFPFLHAEAYLLIAVVLVGVAFNLARLYVRKMFSESVKKTLKGGSAK